MTEKQFINPNTAEINDLRSLPGIGPALAERILAARPFSVPQDLLSVTGISPTLLEKIEKHLVFEDSETLPSPSTSADDESETPESADNSSEYDEDLLDLVIPELESTDETDPVSATEETPPADDDDDDDEHPMDEPEIMEDEEAQEEDEPAPTPSPEPISTVSAPTPKYITRGQAFWMSVTIAFFTFILSIALTLSVLSAMNNGLRFATPDQFRGLQSEVSDLSSQSDTLDGDLADLRTRMDNFEALGGRVVTLETTVETLGTDLDTLSGDLETLTSDIDAVSESVETLKSQTSRFQTFLDGLAQLLSGLGTEESNE